MSLRSAVVIAKAPVAGLVKTRLIGEFTAVQAAELAEAALTDTLDALHDLPCDERVLLLDGAPGAWLPSGWRVLRQVSGGLDQRLAAGFAALPAGPAVLVGMDTPQLGSEQLGFDPARYDACLGLAEDGGYWAIGFGNPARAAELICGVAMSRSDTGVRQQQRLIDAQLRVQLLDRLTDVDTPVAAAEVAMRHPNTGFARAWRAIVMAGVR